MHGPPLEVADLVRSAGRNFIERNRSWLNRLHLKVLTAIERCRTAALGGHLDQCVRCGYRAISFNSCRNRHCPKCQANARDRWLEARQRELLPTRYVHVVFTLPHELAPLALQNKRVMYDLLFRSSAATLLEIARDPKHLGAEIGFFSVLHTWNQKLEHHPHIHCVVPAGGLAPDHTHWIASQRKFFLPGDVLAEVFRGKFREALEEAFANGKLGFHGSMKTFARPKVFAQLLRLTFRKKWVVYLKRPFGGPEHALRYLGCYTHRVAISNHRLVSFADDQVTFRWRDSRHGNKRRLMSLHVNEFSGGSSYMCCRPASYASAISASSAHVTAPSSFPSASGYCTLYPHSHSNKQHPTPNNRSARLGCVLDAMAQCCSSSASLLYNFVSGLRPICSPPPHDNRSKHISKL